MTLKKLLESNRVGENLNVLELDRNIKDSEEDVKKIENSSKEELEKMAVEWVKDWKLAYIKSDKLFFPAARRPSKNENVALAIYLHVKKEKSLTENQLRKIMKESVLEGD